jgi:hypothetical protein
MAANVDDLPGRRERPHIGGFCHGLVGRPDHAEDQEKSENTDQATADLAGTCPAAAPERGWHSGK